MSRAQELIEQVVNETTYTWLAIKQLASAYKGTYHARERHGTTDLMYFTFSTKLDAEKFVAMMSTHASNFAAEATGPTVQGWGVEVSGESIP